MKIQIKTKEVHIAEVKTGDMILSYNTDKICAEFKEVQATHRPIVKKKDQIKIQTSHGFFITSVWHPTLVSRAGAAPEYIRADEVALGDFLIGDDGEFHSVVDIKKPRNVSEYFYDITVKDNNNYFTKSEYSISKTKYVIHNTMGWFDMYAKKGVPCDSEKAVEIADQLTELISNNAINASADLARERGNYPTFEGSEWSKGIVPIDNYEGDIGGKGKLDWDSLREKVKGGIRNSNLMAVAPNASIAYQHGCEQSHEPIFSVIFRYENKSGNYYIVNRHFIDDMKREGIWSSTFAEAVKAVDGDVTQLDIPQKYKDLYKKCFDRDMFKLIDACAARQKWVDQGLSFNLYNGGTSLKYLNDIYMHCWKRGLKSTYYLRNKPASKVAAVTTIEDPKKKELEEFNRMMDEAKKKAESGESCEMCQG